LTIHYFSLTTFQKTEPEKCYIQLTIGRGCGGRGLDERWRPGHIEMGVWDLVCGGDTDVKDVDADKDEDEDEDGEAEDADGDMDVEMGYELQNRGSDEELGDEGEEEEEWQWDNDGMLAIQRQEKQLMRRRWRQRASLNKRECREADHKDDHW
jgi:hypothetical protein